MKKVLIFSALFLLASVSLSAQVVKGAGLWYFNGLPNVTPSVATGTEVAYSINNKALFKWNRTTSAWVAVVQDSSITNELQDLILSNDTLSLTLSDSVVLMAQYRNHVWEIAALSDTASITGDIEGDIAYVTGGDTLAFRGADAWLPFTGGGGGGGTFNSFNIAGDTGSDVVTDGQTVTVAGGYGINTAETGGTVTVTADTSQLVTPSDIAGLMTNWLLGATSGTPQTVSSGQTATIAAGTGMTTTAAATRTVTVALANTAISAGVYGSATQVSQITFDAQGRGILAANVSILLPISAVTALPDSLAAKITRITSTNNYLPRWVGTSMGNSFLSQDAVSVMMDANKQFELTGGTTANRPTGVGSAMYYNTSNNWFDFHNGTAWFNPARSATTNGIFTAGSALFAGSAGTIQQDNANYFWDDTNNRLGIGTTSPQYSFDIIANASGPQGVKIRNSNSSSFTYSSLLFGNDASALSGGFFNNSSATTAYAGVNSINVVNVANAPLGLGTFNQIRLFISAAGSTGIGTTSPDRQLHSELSDAVTNAMTFPLRLTHITSGTAAAGSGAGLEFEAESAGGTNRVAGTIENPYTTATNAAEVSDLVFRTMRAGTLTESLRSRGNGTLQIGTLSGTATQLMGATAGNIATAVTLGAGLSFSSGTLNGAFLPLTLTGTTEVNTAGQTLRFRDAGAYPDVFMNANYWLVASGVNNYIDVGSTASNVKIISDGLIELNSSVNTSLITTGRLLVDSDSIVIDATLPANTNATSVLVRDAVTKRLEEKAIGSVGTWLKPELEAGNDVVIASPGGNEVDISGIDFFYLNPDQGIELSAGATILLQATNNVQALCDTFEVQGVVKITDITNGDATSIAGFNSGNVATTVTPGAGINLTSGEIRTTQSFFNSYDDEINLTSVTTTADTIRPASNTKSNDWSYGPTTYTHTYTGTASRYFSISVSAQVESPNCCHKAFIEVYKNGTVTSAKTQNYITDATAAVTLHGQSIVLLSTGDTINAKFYGSEIGGEDYDILNYSLIVIQL